MFSSRFVSNNIYWRWALSIKLSRCINVNPFVLFSFLQESLFHFLTFARTLQSLGCNFIPVYYVYLSLFFFIFIYCIVYLVKLFQTHFPFTSIVFVKKKRGKEKKKMFCSVHLYLYQSDFFALNTKRISKRYINAEANEKNCVDCVHQARNRTFFLLCI